jgi:hypothetical protein
MTRLVVVQARWFLPVPVGFPFQVVASVLPGLSYLPELRLVTELVHGVGRPFVARAGKIRRLEWGSFTPRRKLR